MASFLAILPAIYYRTQISGFDFGLSVFLGIMFFFGGLASLRGANANIPLPRPTMMNFVLFFGGGALTALNVASLLINSFTGESFFNTLLIATITSYGGWRYLAQRRGTHPERNMRFVKLQNPITPNGDIQVTNQTSTGTLLGINLRDGILIKAQNSNVRVDLEAATHMLFHDAKTGTYIATGFQELLKKCMVDVVWHDGSVSN